jgi:hypothetical protein
MGIFRRLTEHALDRTEDGRLIFLPHGRGGRAYAVEPSREESLRQAVASVHAALIVGLFLVGTVTDWGTALILLIPAWAAWWGAMRWLARGLPPAHEGPPTAPPGGGVFWKAYAGLMLVVFVTVYVSDRLVTIFDAVDVFMTALTVLALVLYAWGRPLLSGGFWRMYFWWLVGWEALYLLVLSPAMDPARINAAVVRGLIIIAPMYVGLWRYAFRFMRG